MGDRVAFVYDWFDTPQGGAERVLRVLHDTYPDAVWYTSHLDETRAKWSKGWSIKTSFIQHLPVWIRRTRILILPLLPFAFESFDLSSYEVVVSVTSAFAKGVITRHTTRHICYLLTPPRWLYGPTITKSPVVSWVEGKVRDYLRRWDMIAASRVDTIISISHEVARRCAEQYGRESTVLTPPFDVSYWHTLRHDALHKTPPPSSTTHGIGSKRYLLVVSRLESYKRVDLAIEAFHTFLQRRKERRHTSDTHPDTLVIVGSGSEDKKLTSLAQALGIHTHICWYRDVREEELAYLYTHCHAYIMPQEEDYGYTAHEALVCGARIVAYRTGGQYEILEGYPGVTFVERQDRDSWVTALENLDTIGYNANTYEDRHIRGWGGDSFVASLSQEISKAI